ncbi:unnamed protein product [Prorocentrum cordatum]|uniref:Uncharacterized protein n=2 Tax=Prorocentrum cordatum TaxID=2364126 RepID=A0ABN9QN74_9DINO|nr:unnamed protein product [Polarella glacialis]
MRERALLPLVCCGARTALRRRSKRSVPTASPRAAQGLSSKIKAMIGDRTLPAIGALSSAVCIHGEPALLFAKWVGFLVVCVRVGGAQNRRGMPRPASPVQICSHCVASSCSGGAAHPPPAPFSPAAREIARPRPRGAGAGSRGPPTWGRSGGEVLGALLGGTREAPTTEASRGVALVLVHFCSLNVGRSSTLCFTQAPCQELAHGLVPCCALGQNRRPRPHPQSWSLSVGGACACWDTCHKHCTQGCARRPSAQDVFRITRRAIVQFNHGGQTRTPRGACSRRRRGVLSQLATALPSVCSSICLLSLSLSSPLPVTLSLCSGALKGHAAHHLV